MALMDYEYNEPYRVAEREEAEKKRHKWLDESIEIKVKDCFEGKPHEDRLLFIKRRDLIDLIIGSGALDRIMESCNRNDLQNMRF